MNVRKAARIMMAKKEWGMVELAAALGVSIGRVSTMINQDNMNLKTLEKLAAVFDMKLSEFIALGE